LPLALYTYAKRTLEILSSVDDGLGNLTLDDHAVVDRIDAGLAIKPNAFGMRIGEQGLEIGVAVKIDRRAVDQIVGAGEVA